MKRRRNAFAINSYNRRHVFFNTDPAAGTGGGAGAPAANTTPPAATNTPPASPPPSTSTNPPKDSQTPPNTPPAETDPKTNPPAAADDWRKDWPDELRNDPTLKDFKNPLDVAKSLIETKKLVGAKPLKAPGPNATPEEKAAFDAQYREAMGIPKDVSGYELKKPDGLPPEVDALFSEESLKQFGEVAHKGAFTKEQVALLLEFDKNRATTTLQQAAAAAQQRETAFMADFTKLHGANADKVLNQAGDLINATGRKEDAAIIASAPQAVRAAMANILHTVAKQYIGEGKLPGTGGGGGSKSLAELNAELRTVIAKPEYRDQFHPDHKATLNNASEISKQIALMQGAK